MKMTARVLFCAALLISAGVAGASAQGITIDTNDVKAMYAVGTTTSFRGDTLTKSANIGTSGRDVVGFQRSADAHPDEPAERGAVHDPVLRVEFSRGDACPERYCVHVFVRGWHVRPGDAEGGRV